MVPNLQLPFNFNFFKKFISIDLILYLVYFDLRFRYFVWMIRQISQGQSDFIWKKTPLVLILQERRSCWQLEVQSNHSGTSIQYTTLQKSKKFWRQCLLDEWRNQRCHSRQTFLKHTTMNPRGTLRWYWILRTPFDAETPPEMLVDHFKTPNEIFYVRNHLPVPIIEEKDYKLNIEIPGIEGVHLSLDDIKTKFKKTTIVATMQCAGNRRRDMNLHKKIYGANGGHTAISNAEWGGVLLTRCSPRAWVWWKWLWYPTHSVSRVMTRILLVNIMELQFLWKLQWEVVAMFC